MMSFIVAMIPLGFLEMIIINLAILLPVILVLISKRARGSKKIGWIIITLILSWLGFILFMIFTKKSDRK